MSIDSKSYKCKGADKMIDVLNKHNTPQKALSLPELLEEVNKNIPQRKNKLNYTNVRRLVRNVEWNEHDKDKLGWFYDKNDRNVVKYYVISNKTLKSDLYKNKKDLVKGVQKKTLNEISKKNSSSNTSNLVNQNLDEKSYYPKILSFLNKNNNFNNESFIFKIWGDKRTNGKWQNPDLVGINFKSEGNQYKIITVEVKIHNTENEILVGIAQCCIYRTFSDYVLFFCKIDSSREEILKKVISICDYYGIGLCLINENKYIVFPRQTEQINRDKFISRRLFENFHKQT